MRKRRMTGSDFEAVRPLLDISENRIEAARAALVDGLTLRVVGERYGWSKQSVDDAINIVFRTFEKYRLSQQAAEITMSKSLPRGWKQVTIAAPSHMIRKFQSEVAKTVKENEKAEKAKRLEALKKKQA